MDAPQGTRVHEMNREVSRRATITHWSGTPALPSRPSAPPPRRFSPTASSSETCRLPSPPRAPWRRTPPSGSTVEARGSYPAAAARKEAPVLAAARKEAPVLTAARKEAPGLARLVHREEEEASASARVVPSVVVVVGAAAAVLPCSRRRVPAVPAARSRSRAWVAFFWACTSPRAR